MFLKQHSLYILWKYTHNKAFFLKIVFQQGTTKLSVEKNKTSITSDIGMQFFDPRTQNILFSTDYETHEFHLPSGVKSLNVQKASTERVWFILLASPAGVYLQLLPGGWFRLHENVTPQTIQGLLLALSLAYGSTNKDSLYVKSHDYKTALYSP